ncbi:Hypothetical predicted protein [Paramuricea clavata]|uniref:Uncharacterized protein n=1 Tax=Paramuricea clavata TaxID=317549 RepID=A0A7D9LEG4_PARCT|nr:Hypothetical predicted protein [Paramuricea clavata]
MNQQLSDSNNIFMEEIPQYEGTFTMMARHVLFKGMVFVPTKPVEVTVICLVVDGREGIILDAREAYTNSGGTRGALATAIYKNLKEHVDLKDKHLLQAQERVLDGQYLNESFIAGMNKPIMQLFENSQIDLGSFD